MNLARVEVIEHHAEEITERFRVALADDLHTLNTHAANVPAPMPEISALGAAGFESYSLARVAAERVDAVGVALAPFAPVLGGRGTVASTEWRRLALLDVDGCDVESIVLALREVKPSTTPGSLRWDSVPWHVLAAKAGARFVLADSATRSANVAHLAAGRKVVEGDGRPRFVY